VADALRDVPEIEDCWFVAGEESFVVKARVPDMAALGTMQSDSCAGLPTRWPPAVERRRIRPDTAEQPLTAFVPVKGC
jgi:DNA-binding Lrp family transcriptional regulator